MIKTFYCALRMLSDGYLYKKNESVEPTQAEREEAEKYFDLQVGTKDLKWIGQIGRIFEGLGLAKQQKNKTNDRYLFEITDSGKALIESIVLRWKKEKPESPLRVCSRKRSKKTRRRVGLMMVESKRNRTVVCNRLPKLSPAILVALVVIAGSSESNLLW
jgi:hypothetical protein